MVRIKICGITNLEDAVFCEQVGADAIGFVHKEGSKRYIQLERIKEIVKKLGPFITTVLVCAPKTAEEAMKMVEESGAECIQLYSLKLDEIKEIKKSGVKVIRVVGIDVNKNECVESPYEYVKVCDAVLFDSVMNGKAGGLGKGYNLSAIPKIKGKIIVAGGLNPENVSEALKLKPYAVDVCSGVEKEYGKKDYELVEKFVERVKEYK